MDHSSKEKKKLLKTSEQNQGPGKRREKRMLDKEEREREKSIVRGSKNSLDLVTAILLINVLYI